MFHAKSSTFFTSAFIKLADLSERNFDIDLILVKSMAADTDHVIVKPMADSYV